MGWGDIFLCTVPYIVYIYVPVPKGTLGLRTPNTRAHSLFWILATISQLNSSPLTSTFLSEIDFECT